MSKRKSHSDNPNGDFCEFLLELADYEKNVSRNIHKFNVYKKAAGVIAAQPSRIKSGDEAKKLKGVGDKIAKKIDEFIDTGKLRKLENIHKNEDVTAISLLTRVSGIGPAKAKELVELNIKTLTDLGENKSKLTHHQLIGLRYFEDFEKPIPRSEIVEIEKLLQNAISTLDPQYNITICGSYRRGKMTSGDIDVLLTHPKFISSSTNKKGDKDDSLKNVVSQLESEKIVVDTISLGSNKFMGVCKLDDKATARRLDIRYIPSDQYYCAILYFTGSDVFNKTMRGHALEKGFTLNEYCLRPIGCTGVPGEAVEISSEQDIFDYIDYPFKKPDERNM